MMAGRYGILQQILNAEEVTEKNHPEFFCRLQQGLLLALQDRGILRITEYRFAEEKLFRQYSGRKKREAP